MSQCAVIQGLCTPPTVHKYEYKLLSCKNSVIIQHDPSYCKLYLSRYIFFWSLSFHQARRGSGDEEALVRKVTLPSEMRASLSIVLVDVIVFWSILSSSSSLRDHDLSTQVLPSRINTQLRDCILGRLKHILDHSYTPSSRLGIQIYLPSRKTGKISCLELSLRDVWCKFFHLIPPLVQSQCSFATHSQTNLQQM